MDERLFWFHPDANAEELSVLHCISREQNQDRDYCRSTRAAKTGVLD